MSEQTIDEQIASEIDQAAEELLARPSTDTSSSDNPDLESTEGSSSNPTRVEQVLGMELRQHAETAREYRELIEKAKTEYKKKYYRKKLKKNNEQAFQILLALEESGRISKIKDLMMEKKDES